MCLRGIGLHRGNPRACGRQCRNEQGDREDEYADELCPNYAGYREDNYVQRAAVYGWRMKLEYGLAVYRDDYMQSREGLLVT